MARYMSTAISADRWNRRSFDSGGETPPALRMTTADPSAALRSARDDQTRGVNGKGSMLFTWSLYLCRRLRPGSQRACIWLGGVGDLLSHTLSRAAGVPS